MRPRLSRERLRRLDVVRDVEDHLRPPGQHLEARRQRDLGQAAAHLLHRHRQTLAQACRARTAPRRRCAAGSRRAAPDARARRACRRVPSTSTATPRRVKPKSRLISSSFVPAFSDANAGGSGSATTAGRPGRKMPAFSRPMASRVRAEVVDVVDATLVSTAQSASMTFTASSRPPRPTSRTAASIFALLEEPERRQRAELEIGQRHARRAPPRPRRSPRHSASSSASTPAMRTRSL